MKSEWRIESNRFDDCKMYIAYRLKDTNGANHSGNREYIEKSGVSYYDGGYTTDRASVERFVAELNGQITEEE